MPYHLSEWRDGIQKALGEYRVAREALDRLETQVAADASRLHSSLSKHLPPAKRNLEGTYFIRVFAVFDAALRSYDRYHFNDQERETNASTMIDQLGALLHVRQDIRDGVHHARRVRNFRAHDLEEDPGPMSLERLRGLLHAYLDRFPKTWP